VCRGSVTLAASANTAGAVMRTYVKMQSSPVYNRWRIFWIYNCGQALCFLKFPRIRWLSRSPLLCAGLIGYRSYRLIVRFWYACIYGFGAAAHIIAQVAVHQGKKVYAFTKPGDKAGRSCVKAWCCVGRRLDEQPPVKLDASIIFAPVGALVLLH